MGIPNLLKFNQALFSKWFLRYQNEKGALWKSIIDSQFGEAWGGWCSDEVCGSYGVALWKYIRRH